MEFIEYTSGAKHVLYSDAKMKLSFGPPKLIVHEHISFYPDGTLEVKKGFPWDGMSGGVPDTKRNMRASLAHDILYKLIRLGLLSMKYRPIADEELKKLCIKDRVWGWVASAYRWGLSIGGTGAALPSAIKKIHRAPILLFFLLGGCAMPLAETETTIRFGEIEATYRSAKNQKLRGEYKETKDPESGDVLTEWKIWVEAITPEAAIKAIMERDRITAATIQSLVEKLIAAAP